MAQHQPVHVDPKQLEHAQVFWHNFTQWLKWASIGIAGLLIVLALAFIDW